jgi:hypothetical protein
VSNRCLASWLTWLIYRSFQSVQMQFRGPVPGELYHRYVEFRPFVAGMFTSHSLRGRLLNRALHHQHARIYNYDRTTKYGSFPEPSYDMTKQFLDLVHYDEGGRIMTYVLTLDGQFRFTETGKEFGIDLLSKHTMHSDVSIYIAYSGEFFVRRIKHPKLHKNDSEVDPQKDTHLPLTPPAKTTRSKSQESRPHSKASASTSQAQTQSNGTSGATAVEKDTDPTHYELVIDNDSGTYRPNAEKLHLLKEYLSSNLPGLKIKTLDCQADADEQQALKKEQREKKKAAAGGKRVMYMQNVSMSSLSSSDEEDLEARAEAGDEDAIRESRYKHQMHKFMDGGVDQHHGDVVGDERQEQKEQHGDEKVNGNSDATTPLEPAGMNGSAEPEKGKEKMVNGSHVESSA